MHDCFSKAIAFVAAAAIAVLPTGSAFAGDKDDFPSKTPIKHVVVIFQENVSFDHYFGTYPHAFTCRERLHFTPKGTRPKPTRCCRPG